MTITKCAYMKSKQLIQQYVKISRHVCEHAINKLCSNCLSQIIHAPLGNQFLTVGVSVVKYSFPYHINKLEQVVDNF